MTTNNVFSSSLGDESHTVDTRFQWRRGTSSLWYIRNTVLKDGEPGVESDTGSFKIGDGVTPWRELEYYLRQDSVAALVAAAIAASPGGGGGISEIEFQAHVVAEDPHQVYDDGTSFILRYLNAKV